MDEVKTQIISREAWNELEQLLAKYNLEYNGSFTTRQCSDYMGNFCVQDKNIKLSFILKDYFEQER